MKKFGIGKKDKNEAEEDCNRSRLFGSKPSKSKSTAPASTNPYAVPQNSVTKDPYAQSSSSIQSSSLYGSGTRTQYTDSRTTSTLSQPPDYDKAMGTMHSGGGELNADGWKVDKSPVPLNGYGGMGATARYNNAGASTIQGGYGDDRYGQGQGLTEGSSRPGSGGYGGLGRSNTHDTMDTEVGREALFGNARERQQKQQAQGGLPPEDNQPSGSYGTAGTEGGYGAYQERQLTAEEEEEEDVQATKQQIRFIKQQDVSSTRNALRIAEQAESTGRETLERLGMQGERIHNTEKNLDLAANQNRLAEEKARELKHLNRSLWAVKTSNPFTKASIDLSEATNEPLIFPQASRKKDRDESIMTQHRNERAERDATRAAAYQSQGRAQEMSRDLRDSSGKPMKKANLAERSKYQFEADSEDEAMEEEIDGNLAALTGAASRLNQVGRAMGKELEIQNDHIDRIVEKTDRVDDQIVMNRARLDRIK